MPFRRAMGLRSWVRKLKLTGHLLSRSHGGNILPIIISAHLFISYTCVESAGLDIGEGMLISYCCCVVLFIKLTVKSSTVSTRVMCYLVDLYNSCITPSSGFLLQFLEVRARGPIKGLYLTYTLTWWITGSNCRSNWLYAQHSNQIVQYRAIHDYHNAGASHYVNNVGC